ncbi:hypothetical protein CCACVL1_28698 [Corchorus capsularis]|uniref:Uncharacterized protein n=1 Tax=Corchorus capsularis TaxID=210143 RepID=A0A1R3G5M3_COCAP|nr:hypothetical protein CCACVL1_28698 [Corchorus capsularis]
MDEREFQRLLELFPVVRPRDYNLEDRQDASNNGERKELENQGTDQHDGFWRKLKVTAESKVSEGLSSDAAQKFLNSQTAEE